MRERFAVLSTSWRPELSGESGTKRIAFYGATDVSEIGYVCLQETDLTVTAVFGGDGTRRFFGTPVLPMGRLAAVRLPAERIFWI